MPHVGNRAVDSSEHGARSKEQGYSGGLEPRDGYSRMKKLRLSIVCVKCKPCGLSVEAIVATVPMAYVHIMPEANMQRHERARSTVLCGMMSP